MNVSFLGLNSSFDSSGLVSQLIDIETQNRILPLQQKKRELQGQTSFYDDVTTRIRNLKTTIDFENIMKGTKSLSPKKVTNSDTSGEYVEITADDTASIQQFNVSVTKLATNTVRKSSSNVVNTLTNASSNSSANFKSAATLSNGTVTVNGVTQTFSNATGTLADIETFLGSFAGVTATFNTGTGRFDLTGVTSFGSSGDTSNLLNSLGLNNGTISGGNASGLQNLESVSESTTLASLGITGTKITINGTDIAYTPATDTIGTLVKKITNSAGAKASATYNAVEGKFIITNKNTGALSITTSSDGNVDSILNLNNPSSETLGDNAEFSISSLYNGATIVSNKNTVDDLLKGVKIKLNKVTTTAAKITIAEDPAGAKQKVKDVLKGVGDLIVSLDTAGNSFSRSLVNKLKNTMGKVIGGVTNEYNSLIDIGLESTLDGNNNFSGYKLDEDAFEEAFDLDQEDLYKILYGDPDSQSVTGALSNGSKGIFSQLQDVLDIYVDPSVAANGIISKVKESVKDLISFTDDKIEREQASIDSLEERYKKQFSQLDVINTQFQQQQSAVQGLIKQLG